MRFLTAGLMRIIHHDGSGVGKWVTPYIEAFGQTGVEVQYIKINAADPQAAAAPLPGAAFPPVKMVRCCSTAYGCCVLQPGA